MKRTDNMILCVLLILIFTFVFSCPVSADEGSDVVEKNLFSPDREKWTMESSDKKKKASKGKKDKVDDIILSGTIVSNKVKSAILSVSGKRKAGKSSVYMEGDYVSGYLLKEISERNVVLQDVQSGEDYMVFLNDEKKNRVAVKTEIRNQEKKIRADGGSKNKKRTKKKDRKKVTTPAETYSVLKDRLNKSLDLMEKKVNILVEKQAANDMKKLNKTVPKMSAGEKKEFSRMKTRFKELKKKNRGK